MLKHRPAIDKILDKAAAKHGVAIEHRANVGNHLHIKLRLLKRSSYRRFITAITSAIRMLVTGASRIMKFARKFWDHRPFTRVLTSYKEDMALIDYIEINLYEAAGCAREQAREFVRRDRRSRRSP